MTSLTTNISAMAALKTLRSVNNNLQDTQQRVSSGYRIAKASDNAAYWSISTTMRSENKAQLAVFDGLGIAQAIVDTTYAALEGIKSSMDEIKALLISAIQYPGFDASTFSLNGNLAKIEEAVGGLVSGIVSAATSASFSGVNLLINPADSGNVLSTDKVDFLSGYANGTIITTSVSLRSTVLFNGQYGLWNSVQSSEAGILDAPLLFRVDDVPVPTSGFSSGIFMMNYNQLGYNGTDPIGEMDTPSYAFLRAFEQDLHANNNPSHPGFDRTRAYNDLIAYVDARSYGVASSMASLGSVKKRLETQENFTKSLVDNYSKGIGRLVDADIEAEATKLAAQQTQQKLATESLSIANSAPGAILSLFQ
jgi:flagellin